MPRNVDPGTIRVGKGLAPEGTVEDNSLRYPERDADPLRVHIHDPSRAHMASSIGIVDELDCYVSDEVEGALQELCGNSAAGRLNGMIAGGTFSELACEPNGTAGGVHATLTLCSPTEILMNGTVFDATGLTVSVPAANTVYFIYLDTHPTSPTYRELVAATGSPPEVEVGDPDATTGPGSIENVMLAKVQMDAGGNVVSWQDARFFVRNLDRKVTYSSRQGENVDAWSEGCFANLQAFFFWAEYYGDGALPSSNEEEKGMVLIRGTHQILSTLTVPTDHLQFVGDGEAIIELTGNASFPGLETSRSDITFRNITFINNALSSSVGIEATGSFSDLTIEDCRFVTGLNPFLRGIDAQSGPANDRILIRNCYIQASEYGIITDGFGSLDSWGLKVENCVIEGTNTPGSAGIDMGSNTGSAGGSVVGCHISDMSTGIVVGQVDTTLLDGNTLYEVTNGIVYANIACKSHRVVNNRITLTDNASLHGIFMAGGQQSILISGNHVRSLIQGNHPSEPYGIGVIGKKGTEAVDARIEGNHVVGFWDATNNVGHGIHVISDNATCEGLTITGNTLSRNNIFVTAWKGLTITGNTINATQVNSGLSAGPTVGGAIDLTGVYHGTVSGNMVEGEDAIRHGVYARLSRNLTITGNSVARPVVTGILLDAADPALPGDAMMENFTVTGNTVDALPGTAATAPTADGIRVSASSDDGAPRVGVIDGNSVRRCRHGILVVGFAPTVVVSDVTVSNNTISECGKNLAGVNPYVFSDAGTFGVGITLTKNIVISGNNIRSVGNVRDDLGAIIPFANNTFPSAVYSLNSSVTTVQGNTIVKTEPYQAGGQGRDVQVLVGGANSSDTVSLSNKIEGNNIVVDDAMGGHHCIVAEADDGAVKAKFQDLSVSRNTIHSVDGPLGNGFAKGIYVTAGSHGLVSGLKIEGNSVENYSETGIHYQTGTAAPVGDSTSTHITVRDNALASMGADGPTAAIYFTVTGGATVETFLHQVLVEGNTVESSWGHGIFFLASAAAGVGGKVGIDDIAVVGNTIDYLKTDDAGGGIGLAMTLNGGVDERVFTGFPFWTDPGVSNVVIADNNFVRVGRAFSFDGTDLTVYSRFSITNNRWEGTGSNNLGPNGDYLCRVTTSLTDDTHTMTLVNWAINGNNCTLSPQDRQVDNWRFLTENANFSVLSVQNNEINAMGVDANPNQHGHSFYYFGQNQKNGAVSTAHKETHISGNTFGGGFYWEQRNSSLYTMDIHGNQITVPVVDADSPLLVPLLVWQNGYDVDGLRLQSLNIRENTLAGGTHGCLLMVDDSQENEFITISGNVIQDARLFGVLVNVDQNAGVSYHSDFMRNLLIDGNVIGNPGGNTVNAATGIRYAAGQAATQTFGITNNQVYNQDLQAIACYFGGSQAVLAGNFDRNITIEDNNLDTCGYNDSALPLISLEVDPAQTIGINDDISSISVSSNTLSNCGTALGSIGVYVDFADYGICEDLRVDNNTMTLPTGSTPNPARLGSCVELDLPSVQRLSVSHNHLRCRGFDGTEGYGVFIQFYRGVEPSSSNPGIAGVTLDSNTITLSEDAEAGICWKVLATEDMQLRDFSVSNNQIRARTANVIPTGILWSGEDGAGDYSGYLQNVHINSNIISGLKTAVFVNQSDVTMLHSRLLLRNCAMDDNSVYECSINGLVWKNGDESGNSGNIHGFSASRNQVTTSRHGDQATAGNPMVGVFFGRGWLSGTGSCNIHSVSVDDNQCYLTTADDALTEWTGIHVQLAAQNNDGGGPTPSNMSTISVDRNHIRNVGYNGIDFDLQGWFTQDAQNRLDDVTKCRNVSCSGNVIAGGTTQVSSIHRGLLRIHLENAVLQAFTLHGNNVETNVDGPGCALVVHTTYLPVNPPLSVNDDNQYWSVQGNVMIHKDGGGQDVIDVIEGSLGNAGWNYNPPVQGTVMGNLNTDDSNAADNFSGAYWTFGGTNIQTNNLVIP